jgi:hypothetical protein
LKLEKLAPIILFFAAFLFSVYSFTVGFHHSLYDEHGFRQTQTAITAYFLSKGGPFFAYETPLLGPPWTIPFELPVYQWLVAKLHLLTQLPLIESGRWIGRLFFWLALLPLYFIFRHCQLKPATRWLGLSLYLLSPLYLFWSRTFLIESTALFFALTYLAGFLSAQNSAKPNFLLLLSLAFFGSLAGSIKVTTALAFFAIAGGLFLWTAVTANSWKEQRAKFLLTGIFAFAIPGILSLLWIRYSDAMKSLSPLADFIRSKELQTWNFGTWQQRTSGDLWYMFFRKTLHDSIGHRTTFLLSLPFLLWVPKRHKILCLVTVLAFLLPPLTFTNLHIEHTYYWYANGIFLLAYLTFLLDGILQSSLPYRKIFCAALAAVAVTLTVREYSKFFMEVQKRNDTGLTEAFRKLQAALPEDDVVLIIGADWYPAFTWEIKRRTIMVRNSPGIASPEMLGSLKQLQGENRKIGALLVCGGPHAKKNQEDLEQIKKWFSYDPEPMSRNVCEQYLVRAVHL